MDYTEAIQFWYGLIDYERRQPRPGDLKLDRTLRLLAELGDPHLMSRVVHIAGTKGKGSTAAMVEAGLRAAGLRTGLFTSPHLSSVEERFRTDGVPVSPGRLAGLLTEIAPAARRMAASADSLDRPTFFEVATAVGFLLFAQERVDVAVVEVGLGGRFDSTNVCDPAVAVITSISLDHTRQLGDRLSQIAREKAGILKPGVPAVCTAVDPEATAVVRDRAAELGCALDQLGENLLYDYDPGPDGPRVRVTTPAAAWPWTPLALVGEHQAANAAGAVRALELLRGVGLEIPDAAAAAGLAGVDWPARLEVVGRAPLRLLDCAHNAASVRATVQALGESFPVPGRRWLVLAVSADKDVPGMLREVNGHFDRVTATVFRSNLRAVPPAELVAMARAAGVDAEIDAVDDPIDAWRAAVGRSGPGDLVLAAGSVFLAGELRGCSS